MSGVQTKTHITEVGRVIVPVSDQERALDFYVGTLGFEKRMDVPYGNGQRWIEVVPPGAPTSIALVPPMEGQSMGAVRNISFTTGDVDATHDYLLEQGVETDPEVMRMGEPVPPMFTFRDPDGNQCLIIEERG
jgi:catechol 2,3-dioxygenase-like lactoylglutathione lyase family enzyme